MYDSSVKMIRTYHAYILMQLIFLKLFGEFIIALSIGVFGIKSLVISLHCTLTRHYMYGHLCRVYKLSFSGV